MFYQDGIDILKTVLKELDGEWVISVTNPQSPFFISNEELERMEKIAYQSEFSKLTKSEENKRDILSPLIDNKKCVKDRFLRNNIAKEISEIANISVRTVLRNYYMYLATNRFSKERKMAPKRLTKTEKDFIWAIRTFYYSAKKMTLMDAYDSLLLSRYSNKDGHLLEEYPSFYQFKHFFYRHGFHSRMELEIGRNGLSAYQRNKRPLSGNTIAYKKSAGYYQMDATTADIYLVSRYDPSVVVGRPYIYLAVDSVTELIAGVYVGFCETEESVLKCLFNAASNKVEYCQQYGIEISEKDWPSRGLPGGIITDQGKEFINKAMNDLCMKYGMEIEVLPPFRPDEKALVERSFEIIQNKFKPLLRGKGVIEPDVRERWATDYRAQAILNIDDFTKIILEIIVYLNRSRILKDYPLNPDMIKDKVNPIPSDIFNWYLENNKSSIINIDDNELYFLSLKRKTAKLTRKGIRHLGIYYRNNNPELYFENKNKNITIAYDENKIGTIYLVEKGHYHPFYIPEAFDFYRELNETEYQLVREKIRAQKSELIKKETKERIKSKRNMKMTIKTAELQSRIKDKDTIKNIKTNREKESGMLS